MMRITKSHILVFSLISSAVDAQSASEAVPPSLASLDNIDPSFAPVVGALLCAFLFVSFFTIYLRHFSDTNLPVADPPVVTTVDYPPCEPQGIDPKLLDTFPIFVYSTFKHLKLGSVQLECTVCLNEFRHDDTVRLLPKCNHVFHPNCINTWLASQVTCPVCRAVLKPEHHHGEDEVVMVIQNIEVATAQEEVGGRPASRTEVGSGERGLRRCHSTGHSLELDEWRGKAMERYTPTLPEEGSSRGRLFLSV